MRKIINGKQYDTEKAKMMGEWANTWNIRDFSYISETLYKKRNGEFFLYGEGGPNTKYATSLPDGFWSSGSKIIPITWDHAKEWAEKHLTADEYEAIFGEIEDDGSKTIVTISLSSAAVEKAKRAASQAGITLSAYIESII